MAVLLRASVKSSTPPQSSPVTSGLDAEDVIDQEVGYPPELFCEVILDVVVIPIGLPQVVARRLARLCQRIDHIP